jgi:hypothetical protein
MRGPEMAPTINIEGPERPPKPPSTRGAPAKP